MRIQVKLFTFVIALSMGMSPLQSAFTDMTFVQEEGQPSGGKTGGRNRITTYITSTKMKTETSRGAIVIFDIENKKVINLDSETKKYSISGLDQWANMQRSMPEEIGKFVPKVTVTEETKVVNGYKCTKVIFEMGVITQTCWVTREIKPDKATVELNEKWAELYKDIPIIASKKVMWRQYQKMNAFPVKIITIIKPPMPYASTMILKSHNYDKIDPSVFEIPKNYTALPTLDLPLKSRTASDTESKPRRSRKMPKPCTAGDTTPKKNCN